MYRDDFVFGSTYLTNAGDEVVLQSGVMGAYDWNTGQKFIFTNKTGEEILLTRNDIKLKL